MINTIVRRTLPSLLIALVACNGTPTGPNNLPDGSTADVTRTDSAIADTNQAHDAVTLDAHADATNTDSAADSAQPPGDVPSTGTGCAGHNYLFCEDFESTATGSLPTGWSIESYGNATNPPNASVTGDEHHAGGHSLASAVAPRDQHRTQTLFNPAIGAAGGTHWGRVFYKVHTPTFIPTSGYFHNSMLSLNLNGSELRVVDTVSTTGGVHQFLLNTPDDSCCIGSSYNYHSFDGAWHCAEWHVDQAAQSYHFYFDGTEVTDVAFPHAANETRRPIMTFTGIILGLRGYQDNVSPSYQAWFDDVAIDTNRIGCD